MPSDQLLTVAEVADRFGVTVRTLHHYDRIGLLVPAARTDAGYRLYGPAEQARLREILTWRRLGVALGEIPQLLEPGGDRVAVLRRQRELVRRRQEELRELAEALDQAIDDDGANVTRTDQAIIDALGGFDPADHEQEARESWGGTDEFHEAAARAAAYGADDWGDIKREGEALIERLAELWRRGVAPDAPEAHEAAEAHRAHITARFYRCTPEIHLALGELYVSDERFTAAIEGGDGTRAGLAAWIRDAFASNAAARR